MGNSASLDVWIWQTWPDLSLNTWHGTNVGKPRQIPRGISCSHRPTDPRTGWTCVPSESHRSTARSESHSALGPGPDPPPYGNFWKEGNVKADLECPLWKCSAGFAGTRSRWKILYGPTAPSIRRQHASLLKICLLQGGCVQTQLAPMNTVSSRRALNSILLDAMPLWSEETSATLRHTRPLSSCAAWRVNIEITVEVKQTVYVWRGKMTVGHFQLNTVYSQMSSIPEGWRIPEVDKRRLTSRSQVWSLLTFLRTERSSFERFQFVKDYRWRWRSQPGHTS